MHRWQFKLNRHDDPAPDPTPAQPPADGKPADGKLPQFTGDFDPERAQRALAAAREGEKTAKQQAQEALARAQQNEQQLAAVLKALGKNPDGSDITDPQAVAKELSDRAEAAEARIWTLGVKDAVFTQAADAGVNAKLVYSSNDFRDMLDDLVDQDPDTPAARQAILAKMKEFVAANPEYAAAPAARGPAPDPSQGRGGDAKPVDFRTASKADFDKELAKYRLLPRSVR